MSSQNHVLAAAEGARVNRHAETWVCATVSGLVWLLYFSFGRTISYGGDEFGLLRPVVFGNFLESLRTNFRPLEYLVVRFSVITHFQFWLLVSLCSYVGTAVFTLRLIDSFRRDGALRFWTILLCATSPLAAQAYFRVDTVAQELANLFTVMLAYYTADCLRATDTAKVTGITRRVAVVGILCVLSKETSYGLVLGCSALLWLRYRNKLLPLLIGPVPLVLAGLAWSYFGAAEYSQHSPYGFRPNPLYWLFTTLFSVVVALSPVPTSLMLTGSVFSGGATLALGGIGIVLVAVGLVLYWPRGPYRPTKTGWLARIAHGELSDNELLSALLLFSLVPSMFVKAAELYATQALPYLKGLLVLAIPKVVRVADRAFLSTIILMWVVASSVNLMFYSVVMGARPGVEVDNPRIERWLYGEIERAVEHRTHDYSIYAYPVALIPQPVGACYLDPREPRICLPKNIGSGVPALRHRP